MIDSELSTQLLLRLDNDGRSIIPKESNDESLILYGIANDSHNFHLLNEEIKSWLDYPISKSISILNQTEHEFRSETNQQVFLVEVSEGWEQIALHNLEKLLRLWELQPPIDFSINRPIGRILRDFYRGINSGERIYCQSLLTEIEKSNLLTGINRIFLQIELMSKLGTPEELLQTEELNDILRVARPATVTDYIAKAIDAVHITPNIVENQNWEKFSEEIRNKYPPVVTHNSHILSTEGARCRAIYTLFSKDKNQSLVDTVDFLKRKWSHDNVVSEILNTQSHIEIQTTKQSTALSELERCLSEDEDRNIEYKSTLTTPIGIAESGVEPPSQITLENACIKTVAGFLNTDGGTLLIGVTDGKDIIGIEKDYEKLRKVDKGEKDRFILHFSQLINRSLGSLAESQIKIEICKYENHDIAVVTVDKSDLPIYANMRVTNKQRKEFFYYRTAAGTLPIDGTNLEEYLSRFTSLESDAESYFYQNNYELCIEAATKDKNPSNNTIICALHSADQLKDTASSQKTLSLIESLSESDKKQILATKVFYDIYNRLTSQIGGISIPNSWHDWLIGVDWKDDPTLLNLWSESWSPLETLNSAESEVISLALIDAISGDNRERTLNGLPRFVDSLIRERPSLPPNLINLGITCYEIILDSDPGEMEYEECIRLLEVILNSSYTKDQYKELLSTTNNQIEILGSNKVKWLCEFLEFLSSASSRDENAHSNFVAKCVNYYNTYFDHFSIEDKTALSRVFSLINVEMPVKETETIVPTAKFSSVAIHSLHKQTAERTKTMIQTEWAGIRVEIDTDSKVDSKEFRSMCERVDLMIIHTSRMKHALSDFGNPKNLLKVHGGGASRLFRELVAWVNSSQL